ncbi:MAG: hypothetical protein L0196_00820 [candidate division Zixibacteria bacterium]|nr:hypothetical protein [candidate division Zixibacteria bacterium]
MGELCNIGPKEIQKRLLVGLFGLGFSAILLVAFVFASEPNAAYGLLFIFLFLGSLGVAQARFCT